MRGQERLKPRDASLHANQKALKLIEHPIEASSRLGDVVWEPFGGTCTAAIAAQRLGRRGVSAEFKHGLFALAQLRISTPSANPAGAAKK
jgi:site-specific DNA-methyltransferase (adenine-specific)